jgi:hypothetical protein
MRPQALPGLRRIRAGRARPAKEPGLLKEMDLGDQLIPRGEDGRRGWGRSMGEVDARGELDGGLGGRGETSETGEETSEAGST